LGLRNGNVVYVSNGRSQIVNRTCSSPESDIRYMIDDLRFSIYSQLLFSWRFTLRFCFWDGFDLAHHRFGISGLPRRIDYPTWFIRIRRKPELFVMTLHSEWSRFDLQILLERISNQSYYERFSTSQSSFARLTNFRPWS